MAKRIYFRDGVKHFCIFVHSVVVLFLLGAARRDAGMPLF